MNNGLRNGQRNGQRHGQGGKRKKVEVDIRKRKQHRGRVAKDLSDDYDAAMLVYLAREAAMREYIARGFGDDV